MTLKCKIKEISEIETQQDLERIQADDQVSDEPEEVEELSDDEFQLQELGTIEQMHTKKVPRKDREFYDRNSIGRKHSQKRPKSKAPEKPAKKEAPKYREKREKYKSRQSYDEEYYKYYGHYPYEELEWGYYDRYYDDGYEYLDRY